MPQPIESLSGAQQIVARTGLGLGDAAVASQATLLARANHTGTQAWSTITGTPTTLSGYGITDAVATSRTLTAGTGLTGGGDLSANRTFAVSYGTTAGTSCQGNDSRLGVIHDPVDNLVALSVNDSDWTFQTTDYRDNFRFALGLGAFATVTPTGTPTGSKFLRDDNSWQTIPGGGDALTANPLSQFASTTSDQLRGVISDETGTGALVFATSPTLVTPALGTPSSGTLTNCTGLPIAGLVASTSAALGVGSIELGHASDTTLARVSAGVVSIEGVNIVTVSATQTLTNKTLTSPTLTTPTLGIPASGTLTNCTGYPYSALVSPPTLGTISSQAASSVAITGGSITGITDLSIADGGTEASTAAGARTNLQTASRTRMLTVSINGGGVVLTTGLKKLTPRCPIAGTIVSWALIADASGSVVVDVWKTNAAVPTNSNSITASAKPTLSSQQLATSSTLTGWATSVAVGDIFGFEVESATTVTDVTLILEIQETHS